MNKLDRYIFFRLLIITFFILAALVCIFIIFDFSENSDDFADKGAEIAEIWKDYYLNYIPEMTRLVTPVAVLIACLFLTGQMAERLEIIAVKSSGISLYRLAAPYMAFGLCTMAIVGYLDALIIPGSNAERIAFEQQYLSSRGDRIDRGGIYRQDSDSTILHINFYDANAQTGYRTTYIEFHDDRIQRIISANRIQWVDSVAAWVTDNTTERIFTGSHFKEISYQREEIPLNILPRDLARRSSDIYQLTWPDALEYIESIERIGAGGASLPQTQLYGRMAYPFSILVVCLIGFALATERRKGGKGLLVALGFGISFVYLVVMKVIEPFGSTGTLHPLFAAVFPHAFFFVVGAGLLIATKK